MISPLSSTLEMSATASFPRPALVEGARSRLGVELAVQAPGEGQLLRVGEGLVSEDQHGVLVHPRADLRQRLGVVGRAEIDGADERGEVWSQLGELERHG